jgi:dipeptidyl aminopeptidase/acylaminoacyl peptidase
MSLIVLHVLLPALLASPASSGPGRGISAEDLYGLAEVRDARISPDGSKVLFTLVRAVRDRNAYDADLHLVPTSGGEGQRLTTAEAMDEGGRWSPDGRTIAFTSDRTGTSQVWLIPVAGGEARARTNRPLGARDPAFSPDGERIAFLGKVAPEGKARAGAEPAAKGAGGPGIEKDEEGREFAGDVQVIDRMVYRQETRNLDGSRTHLFVVPVAGGEPVQVTVGDFDVREFAWSPTGAFLAFVANRNGDPDLDQNDDIWVVSAEGGGEPRRLTLNDGPDFSPAWSPDGKWIAYVGTEAIDDLKAEEDLWVVPAEGGKPVNLTASFSNDPESPVFSPNGGSILFRASVRGNAHVFTVPREGGEVEQRIGGDRVISDFSVSRDGNTIAFVASDPMHPPALSVILRDGTGEKPLHDPNAELLAGRLAKPEEIRVATPDGHQVHGWVLRPPNSDPSRKYPCILYVHGGPYSFFGNRFSQEFQFLAARGFVVLYVNPRLSAGYGEGWRRAAGGEWGAPVFRDLTNALDHLLSLGFVDEERLGIAGGSFGGYMAAWAIGHTDRFKAAVVERCVSDLLSFWGTTDVPRFVEMEFGGLPWDNLDRLRSQSPLSYLDRAKTPTLLIAGEKDARTPASQTELVHRALRRRGVPARMVVYPREGHELSRKGEPVHRVDRMNRIAAWFETHLMPKSPTDTVSPSDIGGGANR